MTSLVTLFCFVSLISPLYLLFLQLKVIFYEILIRVILMKLDQNDGLTKKNCLIWFATNFSFDFILLLYSLSEYQIKTTIAIQSEVIYCHVRDKWCHVRDGFLLLFVQYLQTLNIIMFGNHKEHIFSLQLFSNYFKTCFFPCHTYSITIFHNIICMVQNVCPVRDRCRDVDIYGRQSNDDSKFFDV